MFSAKSRKTATEETALTCGITKTGDDAVVTLGGAWTIDHLNNANDIIEELRSKYPANNNGVQQDLSVDLHDVRRLDTSGAWLLSRFRENWQDNGGEFRFTRSQPEYDALLSSLPGTLPTNEARPESNSGGVRLLERLGMTMYSMRTDLIMSLNIIGSAVRGAQMKLGHSESMRPVSIIHHIDRMGVRAIPIMVLMSFLIGAIIAQQGAFQLKQFGAEIFVVDLVGILLLREVCVLLTAIMVAGRTGSSMTAEIGAMKMNEEVDALTVIGLNPVGVLVFPRIVALVVALPLLTVISDMAALAGSTLFIWFYSGIEPQIFILKLRDAIDLSTIFSGLIKAPFMALIIGVMAAVEGMKVKGSAESLGRRTTAAVVKSIFFVILVDGLFAIFYAQIDY